MFTEIIMVVIPWFTVAFVAGCIAGTPIAIGLVRGGQCN